MTISVRTEGVLHDQTSASTLWTIVHNLGTLAPVIDCWVDDGLGAQIKIIPLGVIVVDANTVTASFSSARAGTARVV